MNPKIYALFAGIDKYHPESGVPNLSGCVNDIEAIEEYLRKRITTEEKWKLVENSEVPWKLTNELATRQAIIDGFQKHLCQATSEDVVLFYYAGHGSYEQAPQAFREKDSDSQIETLVCYDSRTKQGRDLADKELSYLIEQVAKNNPHILIVLDCCHSGTATRDPKVVERQTTADRRVRELTEFIFTDEWLKRRLSDRYEAPRHVAIAACRSHQTAKEHKGEDGKRRGAFSYFFTKALQNTQGVLSYADLVQDVNALILSKVTDQSPQIEALAEDLKQTFLGGAAGERLNYFTLTYDTKVYGDWVIKGGALHGIRPATEGETIFAIFPQGTPTEQLSDISHAIARAVITEVQPEVSKIEFITDHSQLSIEEPYWAVTISVPVPQLTVNFFGDEGGIELARKALTTVNEGEPSLFIREAESSEDANYELEAHQGQYWIKQKSDRKSIVAPIPTVPDTQGYTQQRAVQIIKRLEHVARWMNVLELKTPPTSQIQPSDVELEVIVRSDGKEYSSTQVSDLRGEYTFKNNKWTPPEVKLKVTNHSERDIYFQIVELAGDYSIGISEFFTEKGSIRLLKKSSDDSILSSKTTDTFDLIIPPAYLNSGVTEYNEIFKLIVSARDFDASLLAQEGLDTPPPIDRSTNSTGLSGALNLLMDNVSSRQIRRRQAENIDNWMSKEVKLTLIKPLGGVEIKRSEPTTLQPGVVLHSNSSFEGKVELNSLPPNSRDVNSNLLPPILIEDPTLFQPFEFNTTRSGLSKLSVLEISGVQNHKSVTPENPIKIFVDKPLSSNEYVLPLAYDGEFFLPLGTAKAENGKTAITLERLPEPTVNSRSLQGSIKILFQKLATQTFGKEFSYPLLRIAEVSPDGRVSYQADKTEIAAKVTKAKKILLYIHGITGDTKTLVTSVQQAKLNENGQQKTLRDKYDLVLAFDYENLNTTIEENSKLLKQRLEEVGLTDNHGKQLDIVAHSMGGLIARTFVEQDGGNKIVQHLVMLGTPNGGSPWPTVQDWAFAALGIGLNQLSSVAWPAAVVGGMLKFLDSNIKALDQMNPRSSFIKNIATNPDPNVRYTIIAGDRSVRPEALQTDSGGQSSTIKRLMDKLFSSTQERIVNLVFFRQPNDIAVTLESIKSVSENRIPKPRILSPDATCDHVTYFTTASGLEALVKALCEEV